jgi:hypothetical protein
MAGKSLVLTFILCVSAIGARAATKEEIVPAGTIMHCTMDEPNFSSKTAQVGDPVLCHLGPLNTFGHSLFPRGAMLSGHLQESKDPGHFVGKGWLELEFDRIILPGAEVMPLAAKIIAAPHLKADREGKLHSGGHPKRDAVEWMIPVLWPIKLITLPARGPYPALKGESRLTMRLMEDVIVPLPTVARASVPSPPWATPTNYIPSPYGLLRPASLLTPEPVPTPAVVRTSEETTRSPAVETDVATQSAVTAQPSAVVTSAVVAVPGASVPSSQIAARASVDESSLTLLILKGGAAFLSREYWVQGGQMHCISESGEGKAFPLESVDLYQTVRVNRERNVEFILRSKDSVVEQ